MAFHHLSARALQTLKERASRKGVVRSKGGSPGLGLREARESWSLGDRELRGFLAADFVLVALSMKRNNNHFSTVVTCERVNRQS